MRAVELDQIGNSLHQIQCIRVEQMQRVGDQNVQTFLSQEEVGEIEEGVGVVVEVKEVHLGVVVTQEIETEETTIQTLIIIM
jgi:hypothetical protein